MDRRNLRALLRHATAVAGPSPATDAELLDRFRRDRDGDAFAELVRRYGRLVWAVCRPLLPNDADAEDAFQATFLILVRSCGSIRDGNKLAPWLHGVAVRVCSRARRAAVRRKKHEAAAASKSNGSSIPHSAWDVALAAVHEEIARLPESQRVPFVLCCLEGHGLTETARRLGWKLGTLSGRLSRAKQTLMSRLDARGLGVGTIAAIVTANITASTAPAALAGRVLDLVHPDFTIPGSVLYLSQGVVGMTAYRTKLLAASFLLVGGLTVAGSGWLATADAQTRNKQSQSSRQTDTEKRIKELQAQIEELKKRQAGDNVKEMQAAEQALRFLTLQRQMQGRLTTRSDQDWEYKYVPRSQKQGFKQSELETIISATEKQGWTFVGVVDMRWAGPDGGPAPAKGGVTVPTFVFRRPVNNPEKAADEAAALRARILDEITKGSQDRTRRSAELLLGKAHAESDRQSAEAAKAVTQLKLAELLKSRTSDGGDTDALKAQIKLLQERLAAMQGSSAKRTETFVGIAEGSNFAPKEIESIINTLMKRRAVSGEGGSLTMKVSPNGITFGGSPENVKWAVDLVRKLNAK